MADVTIVIPYADYHETNLLTAVGSAQAQTVPVEIVVVRDTERWGAGRARNRGLELVQTEFVVFLDADDLIAPTFVEQCLAHFDGRRYVFTDWWKTGEVVAAPDCPWTNKSWHCITALVPTTWARDVGGFDETLDGGEDTHFYLKLIAAGHCGRRVREPLFVYGADGQRARAFVHGPTYAATMARFTTEFGGRDIMSCCGETTAPADAPTGEKQGDDIAAYAIWGGNRAVRGTITARLYPRTGNGKVAWVDRRDAQARPDLWRPVDTPTAPEPPRPVPARSLDAPNVRTVDLATQPQPVLDGVEAIGKAMFNPRPAPPGPVTPAEVAPDVQTAVRLYRQATADPIALSDQEIDALRKGHTLEITDEGTKINRKLAPDIVTQKTEKPRRTRKPATKRKVAPRKRKGAGPDGEQAASA